jgi:hypothetical protein
VFTIVPVTVEFDEVGLPRLPGDRPYTTGFADWVYYVGLNKAPANAVMKPIVV